MAQMNPRFLGKKKDQAQNKEWPWWLNPYLVLAFLALASLLGVMIYHFFFAAPVVGDKTATSDGTVSQARTGVFNLLNRTFFSKKPPMELSGEEMDALGIPKENRQTFEGVKPENYREKRRMFAMQKYEGGRKTAEDRRLAMAEVYKARNEGSSGELREALESVNDSETLGLMKLESYVARELANHSNNTGKPNMEALIYGYQCLAQTYVKKNMKEKAKEAYLTYLKLMKEKAPGDQGQLCDQAISEIEKLDVGATSPGR